MFLEMFSSWLRVHSLPVLKIHLFCVIFLVFIFNDAAFCVVDGIELASMNITASKGTRIRDLIVDIQKQTGYKVVVSDELADLQVMGSYKDVSLQDLLRRVFRKHNVSILFDEQKKVAEVRVFGSKSGQLKGVTSNRSNRELLQDVVTPVESSEAVDPLSGMPLAELQRLREVQAKELARQQQDPEAIDPLSGMSLGELRLIQEEQHRELERYKDDPEATDPLSGLSLADLRGLQARQQEELQRQETDPEAVDPLSGIPMKELRSLQARHQKIIENREKHSGKSDPLSMIDPSQL